MSVVPVAIITLGLLEPCLTVQVCDVGAPPVNAQFQKGRELVEPRVPLNPCVVRVATGGVSPALRCVSEADAVAAAFVTETVIL